MATGVYRRISRVPWIRRIFFRPSIVPPIPGFFCPEFVAASGSAVSVMFMDSPSVDMAADEVRAASFKQGDGLAVNGSFDSDKAVNVVGEIC